MLNAQTAAIIEITITAKKLPQLLADEYIYTILKHMTIRVYVCLSNFILYYYAQSQPPTHWDVTSTGVTRFAGATRQPRNAAKCNYTHTYIRIYKSLTFLERWCAACGVRLCGARYLIDRLLAFLLYCTCIVYVYNKLHMCACIYL